MICVNMKTSVALLLLWSLFGLNVTVYRLHFFVNETFSWQDAQTYCRQHFDDLSTVRSKDLAQLSSNSLIQEDYFWIGVQRDEKNPNKWMWSEGTEATITFWDDNQPENYHDKCGAVNKNRLKLSDGDCADHMRFYCMTVFELTVVQQNSRWEEALEYCRLNFIDLAIISSEDIMEEAKINSTVADTDQLWMGLRFLAAHWFWVNGEGLGYQVWSSDGEPRCPAENRCGVYDRAEEVWRATDCEQRLNFLCVKKGYVK